MKRRSSRRRYAVALAAACVVPAAYACEPARFSGRYERPAGAHDQWTRFAAGGSRLATEYSAGVPITVIGSYGGTVLDLLSDGNVVLVKWPEDSPHEKWRGQWHSTPVNSEADGAHIFFLWPDS